MGIGEELEKTEEGFVDRLMYKVCAQSYLLVIAFAFEMMLLVLALMSALFGNLNTATETILLLDFLLLGIAIVPTGGLLWYCQMK